MGQFHWDQVGSVMVVQVDRRYGFRDVLDLNLLENLQADPKYKDFGDWEVHLSSNVNETWTGVKISYALRKSKGMITLYVQLRVLREVGNIKSLESKFKVIKAIYDASNEIWVD